MTSGPAVLSRSRRDHRDRARDDAAPTVAGALVSLAVAVLLYSRFGVHGPLNRDEAVYAYGGQQLAHGVAPYVSIFDVKTPLATLIAGGAAIVARLAGVGRDDLVAIRLVYLGFACLTVVAAYALGTRLWHSRYAGLAGAVVFASFRGFAFDAGSGPDAKIPGIFLAVVCMLLLLERRWFWGAVAGSMAFLVWQPFGLYPAIAVVVAVATSGGAGRWRALGLAVAGAVAPVFLVAVYFASAGALGKLIDAALMFPLTGIRRIPESMPDRLERIVWVVDRNYGGLVWVGLVLLLVLAGAELVRRPLREALRRPLLSVVVFTLFGQALYASTDFQSYPDVYPLLIYSALGVGGGVAAVGGWLTAVRTRRIGVVGLVLALTALTAFSAVSFQRRADADESLLVQGVQACVVDRMIARHRTLYTLGDPTSLVLTHRRNPDRFIYLGTGVDEWKLAHLPGGFQRWLAQIQAADPSVLITDSLTEDFNVAIGMWLRSNGYRRVFIGTWHAFVDTRAAVRARRHGIVLAGTPGPILSQRVGDCRPRDAASRGPRGSGVGTDRPKSLDIKILRRQHSA